MVMYTMDYNAARSGYRTSNTVDLKKTKLHDTLKNGTRSTAQPHAVRCSCALRLTQGRKRYGMEVGKEGKGGK